MGTRADFYVGRGADAEWLGSIAFDGYPHHTYETGVPASVLTATDEPGYRTAVSGVLAATDSATLPEQGWPWPWEDSGTTDWGYAFDCGSVWACRFGHGWFPATDEQPDLDDPEVWAGLAAAVFPRFSKDRSALAGDIRSGVIAIRLG